jgi:hypothetical protein
MIAREHFFYRGESMANRREQSIKVGGFNPQPVLARAVPLNHLPPDLRPLRETWPVNFPAATAEQRRDLNVPNLQEELAAAEDLIWLADFLRDWEL